MPGASWGIRNSPRLSDASVKRPASMEMDASRSGAPVRVSTTRPRGSLDELGAAGAQEIVERDGVGLGSQLGRPRDVIQPATKRAIVAAE